MYEGIRTERAVDIPPKIESQSAREVEVEVLPPDAQSQGERAEAARENLPVHALSALVLVAVDSLWGLFELAPPVWVVAIPTCFAAVFVPVYLIQRHVKGDNPGRALAFATLLATLAAVPTPITGTPVGLGLLAWSGLSRFVRKAVNVRN